MALIGVLASYAASALIFMAKRQWQYVGWMVIYVMAFPIYTIIIPLYAFWHMDDFNWGSTRIVMAEQQGKQVLRESEYDALDPRNIPLMKWDDYANENGLPGRRACVNPPAKSP
jgi:chitin synthase